MATEDSHTCPLCGHEMRPERGTERRNEGLVEMWYSCPKCCHRQVSIEREEREGEDAGD
jgi:hypothetical protein